MQHDEVVDKAVLQSVPCGNSQLVTPPLVVVAEHGHGHCADPFLLKLLLEVAVQPPGVDIRQ